MTYYQVNKSWSNAKRKIYDGQIYDSGFESGYAQELDLREKAGDIKHWDRQVKIPLIVNDYLICNYYIDFVIVHNDGSLEYVETKGWASEVWKLKWKIFEANFSDKPGVKLTIIKQQDNFKLRKLKKYDNALASQFTSQ